MANNYVSNLISRTHYCDFRPIKPELIQAIRNNRISEFKYFEVDIPRVGEVKEIPLFLLNYVEKLVMGELEVTDRVNKLCVPIVNYSTHINRQTITYPTFLKWWLNYYGANNQVTIIKLKEEVFYTYPGVLMDANFKVLIYISKEVLVLADTVHTSTLKMKSINCYVSPEVFTTSTVMCRNLVKKFIPELIDTLENITTTGGDYTYKVFIKNIDNILHTPVEPSSPNITEEAYFALEQGKENVFYHNEYV